MSNIRTVGPHEGRDEEVAVQHAEQIHLERCNYGSSEAPSLNNEEDEENQSHARECGQANPGHIQSGLEQNIAKLNEQANSCFEQCCRNLRGQISCTLHALNIFQLHLYPASPPNQCESLHSEAPFPTPRYDPLKGSIANRDKET